jgi:hypothetical protein
MFAGRMLLRRRNRLVAAFIENNDGEFRGLLLDRKIIAAQDALHDARQWSRIGTVDLPVERDRGAVSDVVFGNQGGST